MWVNNVWVNNVWVNNVWVNNVWVNNVWVNNVWVNNVWVNNVWVNNVWVNNVWVNFVLFFSLLLVRLALLYSSISAANVAPSRFDLLISFSEPSSPQFLNIYSYFSLSLTFLASILFFISLATLNHLLAEQLNTCTELL